MIAKCENAGSKIGAELILPSVGYAVGFVLDSLEAAIISQPSLLSDCCLYEPYTDNILHVCTCLLD